MLSRGIGGHREPRSHALGGVRYRHGARSYPRDRGKLFSKSFRYPILIEHFVECCEPLREYSNWEAETVTNPKNTDPRWREFEHKHRGHPATEEAIYAIPTSVIRAAQSTTNGKNLGYVLSEEELQFETDLAKLGGTGFFLKHPISYFSFFRPEIPLKKSKKERELDQRQLEAEESIREMLRDGRGPSEYTPSRNRSGMRNSMPTSNNAGWVTPVG